MDAVKELDLLIEMMRDLLEMSGYPGCKTPEYRELDDNDEIKRRYERY
jgi:hypothetical protein